MSFSETTSLDLTCEICFDSYKSKAPSGGREEDKRPMIMCGNGHTCCATCASRINVCHSCREGCLDSPIINVALIRVVDDSQRALPSIPEIPEQEICLERREPIAMGSYADVMLCTWSTQEVAVKKLRKNLANTNLSELKYETSLAINLRHPNVVRVYGSVQKWGCMGIVMEYSQLGALSGNIKRLSHLQKIHVSLGIVAGLSYLHSKKVTHRDIKPGNILLFGNMEQVVTAKVSDFGISKVIHTMITNTSMAGTPKYSAPELLKRGQKYGASVDIFSLSILLYELFSERDPFPNLDLMQILVSMLDGKRPYIQPGSIPDKLTRLVKRGWSDDPSVRPSLVEFRQMLLELKSNEVTTTDDIRGKGTHSRAQLERVKVLADSRGLAIKRCGGGKGRIPATVPGSPVTFTWSPAYEEMDSVALRGTMVKQLRKKSQLSGLIIPSVLKVLEVVPRHVFLKPTVETSSNNRRDQIKSAYEYDKNMNTADSTTEVSPEVVATMLSLVNIPKGGRVLIVGNTGGYISSLAAQLAGPGGQVFAISTNKENLDICMARVIDSPFANNMLWETVREDDLSHPNRLCWLFQHVRPCTNFHSIIYYGAVDTLPEIMTNLLEPTGSLIAPVQLCSCPRAQQFQLLTVACEGVPARLRCITGLEVTFEDIE